MKVPNHPSGFEDHRHVQIPADEPRVPPQPSDDELELERDMEYFVEPEEGDSIEASIAELLRAWLTAASIPNTATLPRVAPCP